MNETDLKRTRRIKLTFTSISSISTHISSPPRLTFLASQNRRSRASTTEEHLLDFRSEKKTLEIAITIGIEKSQEKEGEGAFEIYGYLHIYTDPHRSGSNGASKSLSE